MRDRLLLQLIKGLGSIPSTVLYILSDVLYFTLFKLIRYRKAVVLDNLRNSFPEKSSSEIKIYLTGFFSIWLT